MSYSVDTVELRKAMAEAQMTTATNLADKAGVSRNTVGGILNGDIRPSSIIIEKIANALDLNGDDIGRIFFSNKLT